MYEMYVSEMCFCHLASPTRGMQRICGYTTKVFITTIIESLAVAIGAHLLK